MPLLAKPSSGKLIEHSYQGKLLRIRLRLMIASLCDFLGGFNRRGTARSFDRFRFLNLGLLGAANDSEADSDDCQHANSKALHV
jgi:hypothetical protein